MALALLAGTAVGVVFDASPRLGIVLLAGGLLTAALLLAFGRRITLAASIGFLGAGIALGAQAARDALRSPIVAFADGEPARLEGRLREDAAIGEFGVTCVLDAHTIERRGTRTAVTGGIRLSIAGEQAPRRVDEWIAGRTLRVTATLRRPLPYRNPGVPDQEHRLALRGLRLFGSVKSAALVDTIAHGSPLDERLGAFRRWTRRIITATLGPDRPQAAAITIAVLIGDRAGLDPAIERRLQQAGVYHVLAISGGNIAILAGTALWLLGRVGLSPRACALATLVLLAAYALLVVGGSSVARATTAAVVYLAARLLDLRTPPRNVIALTAAILVVARPLSIVDAGFWLTFLASLAILEQAPQLAARLSPQRVTTDRPASGGWRPAESPWVSPLGSQVAMLWAATVAAEAVVLPVSAFVFGQVTVAGLLLNFAAIPLMTAVQIAGLATLALTPLHTGLAGIAAAIAGAAADALVLSAGLVAIAPWSAWTVLAPPWWVVGVTLAAWAMAAYAPRRALSRAGAIAWLAGSVSIATGAIRDTVLPLPWRDQPCVLAGDSLERADGRRRLRLTMLDVGQGDATLLQLPGGEAWLVDAGGTQAGSRFDVGSRIVAPAIDAQDVRRLSILVLTHADYDHIGGVPGLVRLFPPRAVWEGVDVPRVPALDAARVALAGTTAAWRRVAGGTRHDAGQVRVLVHHPGPVGRTAARARNDDSIVIEVRVGEVSLLLPADAGAAVESTILPSIEGARLRVLKAGHHGSASSTSPAFLAAYRPHVVLVSAGRGNRHGHPDRRVLDRVAAVAADVYRTDVEGAVQVETDGLSVRVTTCAGTSATYAARGPT